MGLKGQCAICIVPFSESAGKISALQCGHTFHFLCVTKWLEAKKECPNCRRRVAPKTGLIEKLFFDTIISEEPAGNEINYAEEAERLAVQLMAEKNSLKEALEKQKSKEIEVEALKKTVEKEKERYKKHVTNEIPRIRALENLADSTDFYRKQLQQAENKLKACKFYELLTISDEKSANQELSKYIRSDGSVETNQFITLMKKQNDSLNKKMKLAHSEVEEVKKANRELKRELTEKDEIIRKLRNELESRSEGPKNKRLMGILTGEEPPSKRVSMGFDRSGDEFEIRRRNPIAKPNPVGSRLKKEKVIDLNDFSIFEEKEQENKIPVVEAEYEQPSTSTENKKRISIGPIDVATVSVLKENEDDSMSDFPSILVPNTISRRVIKVEPKKKVFPKDYRSPLLAPKGMQAIKKTNSLEDFKKEDQKRKAPTTTSTRISSFFKRENAKTAVDEITID